MTKLEEIARAICKANGDDWDREGEEGLMKAYEPIARAAVETMREPSDAMIRAAGPALKNLIESVSPYEREQRWGQHRMPNGKLVPSVLAEEKARVRYQAMVDAILNEAPLCERVCHHEKAN